LSQDGERVDWSVDYSYIAATFEDDFVVSSPIIVFETGRCAAERRRATAGQQWR
jgi:hypothetical protein